MKPSVQTLARAFGENAKAARAILEMNRAELLAHSEAARQRERECYHAPKTYDLKMHALNECGAFHGVEAARAGDEYADFLNAGDCYAETVIFWRGKYRVQSLGDFIETMERARVRFE